MPRLPVNPDDNENGAAPLTVKVSWAALSVVILCGVIWFVGIDLLQSWLDLDTSCSDEPVIGRRARLAEMASCSAAQGLKGWLFLGWCAAYPLLTSFWLERGLRRAIKKRGKSARRD